MVSLTPEDVPRVPGTLVDHGIEEKLRARCPRCGHEDNYAKPLLVATPEEVERPEPVFLCARCEGVFDIEMPPETYQQE